MIPGRNGILTEHYQYALVTFRFMKVRCIFIDSYLLLPLHKRKSLCITCSILMRLSVMERITKCRVIHAEIDIVTCAALKVD
jgi:hypothetical protein